MSAVFLLVRTVHKFDSRLDTNRTPSRKEMEPYAFRELSSRLART